MSIASTDPKATPGVDLDEASQGNEYKDAREPAPGKQADTYAQRAVPVTERVGEAGQCGQITLGGVATPFYMIFGRRIGRKSATVWVPGTVTSSGTGATPTGCQVSHDQALISSNQGSQLNPGDSFEWDCEAPLYVGPLPGVATYTAAWQETWSVRSKPVGQSG